MSLNKFCEILEGLGCKVEIDISILKIDIEDYKISILVDEEWKKAINGYFKARQYTFDSKTRALCANKFIEFQVVRLDPSFFPRPEFEFTNKKKDKVTLKQGSRIFLLAYLCSQLYSESFHIIKKRLKRRYESQIERKGGIRVSVRFEDILIVPNTACYYPYRKLQKDKLITVGRDRIKACLFNLAYARNESWELRDEIKSKPINYIKTPTENETLEIPSGTYHNELVGYYKVAKSSHFPGQAFLSYYHILEYNFLKVADEIIFSSLKSQLNKPDFRATYENVSKLIYTIKKYDNTDDENEMLKAVLKKYVIEDELIEFIKDLEEKIGENIYSKPKENIFGEKLSIRLEIGHALSNSAKIVKHIRNALVHSSDRHNREDCFMHFSESESIVLQHIPIVRFLAERVIFSADAK